ncbi:hypothetical protein [Litoribacillus peritrichatus]|uniref:Type 4 fimbrial biogenesis protein PilX N-terminal domain-containing protein n=1 Tax=Litoribacillus peritrichatus TaxID=718191 RepID=A0ABP7M404_9GAMM
MNVNPSFCGNREKGAVLLLSLVMSLVLAVTAISSVNVGTINQKIIRNQTEIMRAEQAGLEVIEILLGGTAEFETAANNQFLGVVHTINDDTFDREGFEVAVVNVRCTYAHPIAGYSLTTTTTPETNYFEFDVVVSDVLTGASLSMTQGVRFNYPAGLCP